MKTCRSEDIASPFLISALDGKSGQLHAPAALPLWISSPIPTGENGWAPQPVRTLCRKKENLPLPGIEPWPSSPYFVAISTLIIEEILTTAHKQVNNKQM
jgi:hypothetical protein